MKKDNKELIEILNIRNNKTNDSYLYKVLSKHVKKIPKVNGSVYYFFLKFINFSYWCLNNNERLNKQQIKELRMDIQALNIKEEIKRRLDEELSKITTYLLYKSIKPFFLKKLNKISNLNEKEVYFYLLNQFIIYNKEITYTDSEIFRIIKDMVISLKKNRYNKNFNLNIINEKERLEIYEYLESERRDDKFEEITESLSPCNEFINTNYSSFPEEYTILTLEKYLSSLPITESTYKHILKQINKEINNNPKSNILNDTYTLIEQYFYKFDSSHVKETKHILFCTSNRTYKERLLNLLNQDKLIILLKNILSEIIQPICKGCNSEILKLYLLHKAINALHINQDIHYIRREVIRSIVRGNYVDVDVIDELNKSLSYNTYWEVKEILSLISTDVYLSIRKSILLHHYKNLKLNKSILERKKYILDEMNNYIHLLNDLDIMLPDHIYDPTRDNKLKSKDEIDKIINDPNISFKDIYSLLYREIEIRIDNYGNNFNGAYREVLGVFQEMIKEIDKYSYLRYCKSGLNNFNKCFLTNRVQKKTIHKKSKGFVY